MGNYWYKPDKDGEIQDFNEPVQPEIIDGPSFENAVYAAGMNPLCKGIQIGCVLFGSN